MDRRRFLRTGAAASLSFPYILTSCGDSGDGSGGIFGPDNGGSGGGNSWETYAPQVNDDPYFQPDYSLAREFTDSRGNAGFVDRSDGNRIYSHIFTEGFLGGEISGLEVTLFKEYKHNRTASLFVRDPQRRFMPELISLENAPRFIQMRRTTNANLRCDNSRGVSICSLGQAQSPSQQSQFLYDLFINEVVGPLPSYDFSDMDDLPGHIYIGDSSFDGLKNFSTKLEYATLAGGVVLTIATKGAAGPAAYKVYSVVSTINNVLDIMDETIDGINAVNRLRHGGDLIDKNQEYSIYTTVDETPHLVFFPSSMERRDSTQDIRYLLPINEGNWWRAYVGGRTATTRVKGTKRVQGEDLVVVEEPGVEIYFGFNGSRFIQHGFNFPGAGEIFLNPGLIWGDDRISIGKNYPIESRIVSPIDGISGSISGEVRWDSRQNVQLSDGTPFGDCYRSRIIYDMRISNGNETISERFEEIRWHAKNLGIVKLNFPGLYEGELIEANLNSRMQGFTFPSSSSSQTASSLTLAPSMPHRIGEMIRRLER